MGAFGVFAQGQPSVPSTITLTNSSLTTNGDGAVGYRADGAATISATNTTALTTGAAAPGGVLTNGGYGYDHWRERDDRQARVALGSLFSRSSPPLR